MRKLLSGSKELSLRVESQLGLRCQKRQWATEQYEHSNAAQIWNIFDYCQTIP